ncbi:MAG: Gp49 family protein [Cyanobacteria bacterium P01_F01_bin.3]
MEERTERKVPLGRIDALLNAADVQEHVFWGKELVVSYRLPSGFTVLGRGACVDPQQFDINIGRQVAREMAANELWQLEGYRLQLLMSGELQEVSAGDTVET